MVIKVHKVLEINYLKELTDNILKETDPKKIKESLRFLLGFYSIINFELEASDDFLLIRARKCQSLKGFPNVRDIGPPPSKLTSAGRLNSENNPMLYTSRNMPSAFDEINVKPGDYVQVALYKLQKNYALRVAVIGDIKEVFRWGKSKHSEILTKYISRTFTDLIKDKSTYKQIGLNGYIYTDSFLSDILTNGKANENNYIHTKFLGELLFEKNPELDGIAYQGVESSGSLNFAFKPDTKIDITNIHVFKVNGSYGYGQYDFEKVNTADTTKVITISQLTAPLSISIKKYAKQYFIKNLLGKTFHNPYIGNVNISWAFWKHLTRKKRYQKQIFKSLSLLSNTGEALLNTAEFIGIRRLWSVERGDFITEGRLLIFDTYGVDSKSSFQRTIRTVIKERFAL